MSERESRMTRSRQIDGLPRVLAIALCGALVTTGCGATAAAPTVAPTAPAAEAATPAVISPLPSAIVPVPTVEVLPANAPEPGTPIIPVASTAVEAALEPAWEMPGPDTTEPCTMNPALDPDGRVWVAACWKSELWVFKPDGTFVEAWGERGSEPGQLEFPWSGGLDVKGGAAFGPDGTSYTFDGGNLRVQHFAADRSLLGSWGGFGHGAGLFAKPMAMVIDSLGQVYVGDADLKSVQVFSPDGDYLRTIADGKAGWNGGVYMTADGAGNVYVNAAPYIMKYGSDGTELAAYDFSAWSGSDPTPSAVDEDGNLFVTTWGGGDEDTFMVMVAPDGSVLHAWPTLGETFALDRAHGALYAAHWSSPSIRRYDMPSD